MRIIIMLLGHWIEMRSVRQASGALNELAKLLPDTAERLRPDGSTESVPISQLRAGDLVLARPGASYSGPIKSDTKMGAAKVHSAHGPQTLHTRPESCRRARTAQGRRNPATDRFPAWHSPQPAAQMEGAGPGRAAETVHRRQARQAWAGSRTPAPIGRTVWRDRPADHPVSLAQKKIWPRTWPALTAWRWWIVTIPM